MRGVRKLDSSRVIRAVLAVIAVGVTGWLVSACGGSSRSTLNPAAAAPADSAVYVNVQVPTTDQLSQFRRIVTDIAGARAWTKLTDGFNDKLASSHLTWKRDFAPWIGSSFGVADPDLAATVKEASSSGDITGFVLIFPTDNMKAAEAFARKRLAHEPGGGTYATDGKYLLVGSPAAVAAVKSAKAKLTSAPGYSAVAGAMSGDNAAVYVNLHAVAQIAAGAASDLGTSGNSRAGSLSLQSYLAKTPTDSAVGLGFTATSQAVKLDILTHDLPGGLSPGTSSAASAPDTVSGLPAGSFLAAAANLTLNPNSDVVKLFTKDVDRSATGGIGADVPGAGEITAVESRTRKLIDAILPAFGPLELAAGGTSLLGIKAGLSMTSQSPAAGARLLTELYDEIRSGGSVPVSGSATNFAITEGPIRAHVTDRAGQILALLGYTSAGQLLHPASTLASDPAFKRAVSQLPSGAKVPLFVNFGGISSLLSGFTQGNLSQAHQLLSKLSYLAVGTSPGDDRIVLGLH